MADDAKTTEWPLEGAALEAARRMLADGDEARQLLEGVRERHREELAEMELEARHRCERWLRDVTLVLALDAGDRGPGTWTVEPSHGRLVLRFTPAVATNGRH